MYLITPRTAAKFDAVYKNMMTLQNNDKINQKAWFALQLHPIMFSYGRIYEMETYRKRTYKI